MRMDVLSALNTKNIWHKGKAGNDYQLDSIVSQLSIEKRLGMEKYLINYIDSLGRESEAESLVKLVHSKRYLDVFKQTSNTVKYLSSGLMLQESLYPLALEHALISKQLVDTSLKQGSSFTTVGGGHHCELDKPLGFGLVNTMAISAIYAASRGQRVALLDLDTHYSNGCMELLNERENILMTSLWNQTNSFWRYHDEQNNLIHQKVKDSEDYFQKLEELLSKIKDYKPSIFIYHLGFDVLEMDRMGGIKGMSKDKLIQKERMVKQLLNELDIPYLIYRGGGYVDYRGEKEKVSKRKTELLEIQTKIIVGWINTK